MTRTTLLSLVPPGEADDLVAHAGDERDEDDAAEDEQVPGRAAHGREHEDRDHQHDEQERRAAAQVQGLVLLDVGHGELFSVLQRVDAHVLRAVVLEHAAQVLDLGDDGEVGEEDADAHEALDHPEQEALAEPALQQAGEEQRGDEEEADGEGEGDDERDADLLLAQLPLLLAQRLVGRDGEGADADDQRFD